MNTENKYFTTKEHYINFINAWSATCNSAEAKPTYRKIGTYVRDEKNGNMIWDDEGGTLKQKGCLKAEHYMLYNILRGHPQNNGFTLRTNPNKIGYGVYINQGEHTAYMYLKRMITRAQECMKSTPSSLLKRAKARLAKFGVKTEDSIKSFNRHAEYLKKDVENFLAPFGGTVTVKMLAKLELKIVNPIQASTIPIEKKQYSNPFVNTNVSVTPLTRVVSDTKESV